MKRVFLSLIVFAGAMVTWSFAQQPGESSAEQAAIRKADAAYVAAYNSHDAKALADAWSPDAVYLNRNTGAEVVGRAAIAEQFTAHFKDQPDVKLELNVESIRFVSPNVAVEQGVAKTLTLTQKAPEEQIGYSAVFVRRDGQWLLDRVTEKAKESAPTAYEQLKPLEWMIGHWVDKDDKVDVETDCKWTKNRSYLTRSFTVAVDGDTNMSGMQIIGWDPAAKTIRSWTFDSDGGFAAGAWTFQKGRWFIRNKGVLADGRKTSMVNIIKPVDENSFTWQTVERTAGGELLPNIDEVLIVRE